MRTLFDKRRRRHIGTVALGALAAAALGVGAVGCGLISSNIFDITIGLSSQTYGHDFGTTSGKVPKIACPATPDPCGALAGQVVATRIPAWVEWLQSLWFPWS